MQTQRRLLARTYTQQEIQNMLKIPTTEDIISLKFDTQTNQYKLITILEFEGMEGDV